MHKITSVMNHPKRSTSKVRFGPWERFISFFFLLSLKQNTSQLENQVTIPFDPLIASDIIINICAWILLPKKHVVRAISGTWKTWIGGYGAWFTRSPNLSKLASHSCKSFYRWSQGPYGHGYISSDMHVEIAFPRIFLFVRFRWFLGIDRLKCNMSTI